MMDKFKTILGMISPEQLREKRAVLSDEADKIEARYKFVENLLALYKNDAYESFKSGVLVGEKDRIANERMKLPIDKRDEHLILQGKYEFACQLLQRKSELETEFRDLLLERESVLSQLKQTQDEISADQKRRGELG